MENLNVVVALITRDNDYQAEQAASAVEAAARLGVKVQVMYADNDAVNQTQQLVKIIQDPIQKPTAIIVEPVGTEMVQVAKAAVAAGIGWGVLNREPDYIAELNRGDRAPVFAVTTDQIEVGRLQGKQLNALVSDGNVLYIEGPFSSSVSRLRTKGMLSTKPAAVELKMLKGDWTEHSAHQAVKSWLSLSTSRQLHIRTIMCQNDAMAMGARKALVDLTEKDREHWMGIPFTGCDGVTKTGQEWVRRGMLTATVVTPPNAGIALDILCKSIHSGSRAPEKTMSTPHSVPTIEELIAKRPAASAAASAATAAPISAKAPARAPSPASPPVSFKS
jgi:ribose transport system substrate-binding protein